jgi:hypothetical protein
LENVKGIISPILGITRLTCGISSFFSSRNTGWYTKGTTRVKTGDSSTGRNGISHLLSSTFDLSVGSVIGNGIRGLEDNLNGIGNIQFLVFITRTVGSLQFRGTNIVIGKKLGGKSTYAVPDDRTYAEIECTT